MGRPDRYLTPDGDELPSVTTLLSELGWNRDALFHWADKLAREGKSPVMERNAAARRGTMVHETIEWAETDDDAEPPQTSLEADLAFDAWGEWRSQRQLETLAREQPIVSPMLGFAGTPDLVARENGIVGIYDWKTASKMRAPYLEHIVQVTAYAALWAWHCANEGRPASDVAMFGVLVKMAPDPDDENKWLAKEYRWRLDAFGAIPMWTINNCLHLRRARKLLARAIAEAW